MSSPEGSSWGPGRTLFWGLAVLLAALVFGPQLVRSFRPADGDLLDFCQEWLSVKNYRAGLPVYSDQTEALFRHTGLTPAPGHPMLPWNAHPPASILLALPFGSLGYEDAQFAWNLATLPLFVVSLVLVFRELRIPYPPQAILPTLALGLICYPLFTQIAQGQLNFVLVFLITVAWAADRRGYSGWAGAAVGAAAAVKLFPAFLFLYFVCTRRWRAVVAGGVVFLALNGAALALFGVEAFRTYVTEVVPSVSGYVTDRRNASLTGFWLRMLTPEARVNALADAPLAGRIIANVLGVAITAVTAWVCWRAADTGRRDRAFAATVLAMLLVSPITWPHYFVLLPVPLAVLWTRLPAGPPRWLLVLLLVPLWVSDIYFHQMFLGRQMAQEMLNPTHRPITPAENLYVLSLSNYALLGLFLLTLLVRPDPKPNPAAAGDAPAPGGRP
jgi:hypothetical protein